MIFQKINFGGINVKHYVTVSHDGKYIAFNDHNKKRAYIVIYKQIVRKKNILWKKIYQIKCNSLSIGYDVFVKMNHDDSIIAYICSNDKLMLMITKKVLQRDKWNHMQKIVVDKLYEAYTKIIGLIMDKDAKTIIVCVGHMTNKHIMACYHYMYNSISGLYEFICNAEFTREPTLGHFGYNQCLSSDGKYLVIGYPYFDRNENDPEAELLTNNANSISEHGIITIYEFIDNSWKKYYEIFPPNSANEISFGNYVDIAHNGEHIITSSYRTDINKGMVYVYKKNNGIWDIEYEFKQDSQYKLGRHVSISFNFKYISTVEKTETSYNIIVYKFSDNLSQWNVVETIKYIYNEIPINENKMTYLGNVIYINANNNKLLLYDREIDISFQNVIDTDYNMILVDYGSTLVIDETNNEFTSNNSEMEVSGIMEINNSLVIDGDSNDIVLKDTSTLELHNNIEMCGEDNTLTIQGTMDVSTDSNIITCGILNLEGDIITNDNTVVIESTTDSSIVNIRNDYTIGDDIKLDFISGQIIIDVDATVNMGGDI